MHVCKGGTESQVGTLGAGGYIVCMFVRGELSGVKTLH